MKKISNSIVRLLAIVLLLLSGTLFITGGLYKRVFEYLGYRLIDFNGNMSKFLHMQGYNSDIGLYSTDENYYVTISGKTSTDYEVQQTLAFRDFLADNNIQMIYVNEPTKYVDDFQFREAFGVESYCNRNSDLLLERLEQAGINTIDIRENIAEEGIDITEMFYKTDHHWTTPAGLWASRIMAEGLNQYCGYDIDLSLFDKDRYEYKTYSSCWLGEQGKKMGVTYSGLEDYTKTWPSFETDYTFINKDGTESNGDFSDFINESAYYTSDNIYLDGSWHYSYRLLHCINNNVENGKVLIVCDSYAHVTECFLSLGVHETDAVILRDQDDDFRLRDYILQNGYDTVIVAYSENMIGAHDDPENPNYRMFAFDR